MNSLVVGYDRMPAASITFDLHLRGSRGIGKDCRALRRQAEVESASAPEQEPGL